MPSPQILLAALLVTGVPLFAQDSLYSYSTRSDSLRMPDGAQLAITWWRPNAKYPGETFPVLFEYLPYRKDDSFYSRDFPLYDYFTRRGFIMAKVDIRGTGGSTGPLPPREYSEQELDDAEVIIARLARIPASNGSVGMWGISWGGFNSLQVAMRRPPALKAIIALHASDDLYHDDVRYIDGGLHIDPYTLQIDHENGLPRTPAYALDSAYFRDRFEAYPWVLTYLKQPVDGPFWRRNALRFRPEALTIPAYLIGGLLDGYRDTPIRALEYLRGPVKVEIGPWNHSWPDDGTPGPNYEWRARAVRWWNQWLRGGDSGLLAEPRLMVFERSGHGPDRTLEQTPGRWRFEDWPVKGARRDTLHLAAEGRLEPSAAPEGRSVALKDSLAAGSPAAPEGRSVALKDSLAAGSPAAPEGRSVAELRYLPGFGTTVGDWWGEPSGDMRRDDAGSMTFDGPVLLEPVTILGLPRVQISAVADAPLATWSARLEDVAPDGAVSLVGGGLINATQYRSSTAPERLVPGQRYDLGWEMHFTTWVFRPGHRIRLSLSNAQFPMVWPTPYPMVSRVLLDDATSLLELPVVPASSAYPEPVLPAPEPRAARPDVTDLDAPAPTERIIYDPLTGQTTMKWTNGYGQIIGATRIDNTEREEYRTSDHDPSRSSFYGFETHRIRPPGRDLLLETTIDIRSDSTAFHVVVTRRISSKGRLVRQKRWDELVPREFH